MASKTKNVRAKPLLTLTYANWQKVRFGDVVREVKDTVDRDTTDLTRFIAGEHMGSEDLHLRTWGDINGDYLGPAFHRIFRKGQVLYGSRRTYLKKVAVASFDGICANTTFVLESRDPDVLLPELLPFVMLTDAFTQHSVRESKGSVNPYINWKDIAKYEFLLPPKDEQRRIADILWAADESVEAFRTVLANLKSLGDTKAFAVFSTEKEGLDSAKITMSLSELAEIRYGLTVDGTRRKLQRSLPYLRVANVHRGKLDLSEIKEIGADDQDLQECALRNNDVLVVEGHADPTEIGRAAIWQGEIDDCLHQNHILRVRTSNDLLPHYLLAFLNSPKGKSHIRRCAKSSSGLYTINSTVLREMQIPIQSIDHQKEVVDNIEAIHRRVREVEKHLVYVTNMKNRIVRKLLDGHNVH
ncbi:MAG: restriction endonuclease subunit S [Pirellula sp.]|nr:restriction endonuclease subunit S [Pirellula sp.]